MKQNFIKFQEILENLFNNFVVDFFILYHF